MQITPPKNKTGQVGGWDCATLCVYVRVCMTLYCSITIIMHTTTTLIDTSSTTTTTSTKMWTGGIVETPWMMEETIEP
jgi:hypothetical protein